MEKEKNKRIWKNGRKSSFRIQNSDVVTSRSKQPIFFLGRFGELENLFLGHFIPLILYTKENPLKPPHYFKGSNGKHG